MTIEIKDTSAYARISISKDALGNPQTLQIRDCKIKVEIKKIKFSGNALSGIANAFEKQLEGFIEDLVEKQGCKAIEDVELSMKPVVNFFPTCSTRPPGTLDRPAREAPVVVRARGRRGGQGGRQGGEGL